MSARPECSVIVPAFNESERIASSLDQIAAWLAARAATSEIVVVDDGSVDETFATVKRVAAEAPVPVRLVRYARNRGKGYALKIGVTQARGDLILFTDADLSVPIEYAGPMLEALEEADVAIACRHIEGAEIAVSQPLIRRVLGGLFTLLVRALISPVNDATCGFKAFRGEVGRLAFQSMRVYDWSFDAEILFLLRRAGRRVREIPVHWEHREGTKVRPLRDGAMAFVGLVRIRWGELRGRYRHPNTVDPSLEVWESTAHLSETRARVGE